MKTILIIIGIYFLFRLFMRYVAPYLVRRFLHKVTNGAFTQFEQNTGFTNNKQAPNAPKKPTVEKKNDSDTDFGEYVDFEEIK